MFFFASALAAVIPMSFYLFVIWWFDQYDREPVSLLLLNFFWGAFGAIILTLIGSGLLSAAASFFVADQPSLLKIETIFIAPFVEEITKGIFLLITVTNKKFDNITDGIVYGGAIGLGFGMTENFLYFISYGTTVQNWIALVVIRTLFSGVMHAVASATFGAFLGYSKFKNQWFKFTYPLLGLIFAMFIHFAWNFSVSFESTAVLGFIFMGGTSFVFILIFIMSISQEKKIIYTELLEEAGAGIIPMEHIPYLYTSRRNKFGWVDESIRKLYIKTATKLAFRKMQMKNSKGLKKMFLENEVTHHRTQIQTLLSKSGSKLP